ncbi:hypothetical protein [Paenibacillus sp. Y412MC10]|uniref:hypothetical protein n=1 Tax=Geobacillus sp. (strain Y412MC10) TaxID=481743 RepID=UPI0011A64DB5|nr:hypothetical protein [Paenibacillus sp. Y412MC10]
MVELNRYLMEGELDERGGKMVEGEVERQGMSFLLNKNWEWMWGGKGVGGVEEGIWKRHRYRDDLDWDGFGL